MGEAKLNSLMIQSSNHTPIYPTNVQTDVHKTRHTDVYSSFIQHGQKLDGTEY